MISKKNAHKVYDRNTTVINKGDPGWTSDNHLAGRDGERYGTNPLSVMDQKIRQRNSAQAIVPEQDPNDHPVGTRTVTGDGRDAFHWEVKAIEDKRMEFARVDYEEGGNLRPVDPVYKHVIRHVWRLRFTERNGDR